MKNNVQDAAEQIMKFKTHRDPHVRKMVITLIPTLAMYDTQTFTEHHLHKAMAHLLAQLEKPSERSVGQGLFGMHQNNYTDVLCSVYCYRSCSVRGRQ